jgi:hypothetical protein
MKGTPSDCGAPKALVRDIPHRYGQVANANRRVFPIRWAKVPICAALRAYGMENRGH